MDILIKLVALAIFGIMILGALTAIMVSSSSWFSRPASPLMYVALVFGLAGVLLTVFSGSIGSFILPSKNASVQVEPVTLPATTTERQPHAKKGGDDARSSEPSLIPSVTWLTVLGLALITVIVWVLWNRQRTHRASRDLANGSATSVGGHPATGKEVAITHGGVLTSADYEDTSVGAPAAGFSLNMLGIRTRSILGFGRSSIRVSESPHPKTTDGIGREFVAECLERAIHEVNDAPKVDEVGRNDQDEVEKDGIRAYDEGDVAANVEAEHFDVFLAHNSKDKDDVELIAAKLRSRGIKPWLDKEQIPPGQWFQDVIQRAIRDVKSAAVFIGSESVGKWQTLELRAFVSQCIQDGFPVIPVLLPGVSELPPELLFLKELNWVKFADSIHDADALDNLEWGITGKRPKG